MNKREFLDILRQTLGGEVRQDIIEQNIKYYDNYISSHTDELAILTELGDPRLIARTIIESNRAAKQKHTYNHSEYSDYYTEDEKSNNKDQFAGNNIFSSNNIKWYHKLILIIIILLALSLIIALGRIIFSVFLVFGLPVILILIVLSILRRR
jgi:uncharacterized membrane protein